MLEILLLGQPEARYNEEPLAISRRIVRHLMVYLACAPERVGRSELASLFWPESDGPQATSYLRDSLRRLREQLPQKDILMKYGTQVFFDPERTYVDVRDFSGKVASIKRSLIIWPSYKPIPAATLALMQEAVKLWRSPRFLYGIDLPPEGEYADWVIKTGQQLELDRQYLLGKLAENALVYSNPMQALEWIQLGLQTDELNPELNLHYLETLVEMDRLPEANMHLRYLQARYEKAGLGDLPAALEHMSQRMQQHTKGKLPEVVLGNIESFLETPFVGQAGVLQTVDQVVQNGEGVVISGGAGAGKTRLMHELENRYTPGFRFMHMPAKALEKELTYSAITALLQQAVRKDEWQKLKAEHRRELASLLPELSLAYPEDASLAGIQLDSKSQTINEAVYQLLLICSYKKNMVVALDNAQWCDQFSYGTILHLAQRGFFRKAGRLVITFRSEIHAEALDQFLNDLRAEMSLPVVAIEALEATDIGHLTQFLSGEKTSTELNEYLKLLSAGNTLILIEMVRSAMGQFPGRPLEESIHLLSGSTTLAGIIQEKFQQLTRTERSLVNIAVVYGNDVDTALLAEVSGYSPELVAETLESLDKEHHMLQPITREKRLVYSFTHEKIRETVEGVLYPSRKRLLHERIAEILAKRNSSTSQDLARIAHHFEQAGISSQAIQYRVKAARAAWQAQFPDESIAQLELAESLLREGQDNPPEDIYAVFSLWGELAVMRSDLQTMQRAFTRLYQAGQEKQSPQLAGAGLSGLALLQALNGKIDTALQIMDRAHAFLDKSNSVYDRMIASIRTASIFMFISRYQQAKEWYLKALEMDKNDGESAQNLLTRIQAKVELAFLYILCGQPEIGLEISLEAYRSSDLAFFSFGCLSANISTAMALYYLGHYPDVIRIYHENMDTARIMRNGRAILYFHLVYARTALAMGRLGECLNQLKKIKEVEKQIGNAEISSTAHAVYGEMLVNLGDYFLAEKEFIAGSSRGQNSYDVLNNRLWLGMVKRYMGRVKEGNRIYSDALLAACQENMLSLSLPAEIISAIWDIQHGQHEEAAIQIAALEQKVQECGISTARLLLLLAKCRLAERRQEIGQVKSLAEQLARDAAKSQQVWMEIQARTLLHRYTVSREEKQLQENRIKDILAGMSAGIDDVRLAGLVANHHRDITFGWGGD